MGVDPPMRFLDRLVITPTDCLATKIWKIRREATQSRIVPVGLGRFPSCIPMSFQINRQSIVGIGYTSIDRSGCVCVSPVFGKRKSSRDSAALSVRHSGHLSRLAESYLKPRRRWSSSSL